MEMEKEQKDGGGLFVKVMSDDQLELLRRQISAYVVLSQQLADMHKSLASQQSLYGMSFGSVKYDPLMAYNGGHKMSSRQRWSPSPEQLQLLERIFEEGNGTPTKLRIKTITEELSQFGQISETNVYNWFQNRRARSKRKPAPNDAESQPLHGKSDSSEFSSGDAQDHFYFPSSEELVTWPENLSVHELQQGLPSWSGF